MAYVPNEQTSIEDIGQLHDYVRKELREISRQLGEVIAVELRATGQEPKRPRDGMIVYADGNWDPGDGEGLYVYSRGAWYSLDSRTIRPYLIITANDTDITRVGNLELIGDDDQNTLFIMRAFGIGTCAMRFYRALGTAASPSGLTSGEIIGLFGCTGRHSSGDATGNRARITMNAAENWTSTANGAFLSFNTTPTGSITIAEAFRCSASAEFQAPGAATIITSARHIRHRSYTVATLPSAANAAELIYVSDMTGGAELAFSDGTNWRRVSDRTVAS